VGALNHMPTKAAGLSHDGQVAQVSRSSSHVLPAAAGIAPHLHVRDGSPAAPRVPLSRVLFGPRIALICIGPCAESRSNFSSRLSAHDIKEGYGYEIFHAHVIAGEVAGLASCSGAPMPPMRSSTLGHSFLP
jgi:hypothetical protein